VELNGNFHHKRDDEKCQAEIKLSQPTQKKNVSFAYDPHCQMQH